MVRGRFMEREDVNHSEMQWLGAALRACRRGKSERARSNRRFAEECEPCPPREASGVRPSPGAATPARRPVWKVRKTPAQPFCGSSGWPKVG